MSLNADITLKFYSWKTRKSASSIMCESSGFRGIVKTTQTVRSSFISVQQLTMCTIITNFNKTQQLINETYHQKMCFLHICILLITSI